MSKSLRWRACAGIVGSSGQIGSVMQPETRYAKSGDVYIAYQVIGDGPIDVVEVPGWLSHLEHSWGEPPIARFLGRLASFSRLIRFDKRGDYDRVSLSDLPTLEQRMDDVRAVMDAVGSERAVPRSIGRCTDGSPVCRHLSAPNDIADPIRWIRLAEPVSGLSLGTDRGANRSVHPINRAGLRGPRGPPPAGSQGVSIMHAFNSGLRPSVASQQARALLWPWPRWTQIDVRNILPTIRVPTLVLHRTGDRTVEVGNGRYLAEHIPEARYISSPAMIIRVSSARPTQSLIRLSYS